MESAYSPGPEDVLSQRRWDQTVIDQQEDVFMVI